MLIIAPVQKENKKAKNVLKGPKKNPIESANFESPYPIHFSFDIKDKLKKKKAKKRPLKICDKKGLKLNISLFKKSDISNGGFIAKLNVQSEKNKENAKKTPKIIKKFEKKGGMIL